LSIPQPAKLAIPAEALRGFEVQVSVAPAGVTMLKVTCAELTATVLPSAAWTITAGWVMNGTPPVELEGLDVNERWVAGPETAQLLPVVPVVALNAAPAEPRGAIARAAIDSIEAATPRCGLCPCRSLLTTDGTASPWFPGVPVAVWVAASARHSGS
jgi:hypothetical protein